MYPPPAEITALISLLHSILILIHLRMEPLKTSNREGNIPGPIPSLPNRVNLDLSEKVLNANILATHVFAVSYIL